MRVAITLAFQNYIGHPYWPEREKLINIQKESGTKRARSEARAAQSLRDYLAAHNLSMEDYHELERLADRQFYTVADVLEDEDMDGHRVDEIVIPSHQFYGCLAQGSSLASSSVRLSRPEQIRTVLKTSDLFTGRYEADGVWERYVTVTSGAGVKLSNQRALRANSFLRNFEATGKLYFSEQILVPQKVHNFLMFCGREIGVGASRKLDKGRFTVAGWEPL